MKNRHYLPETEIEIPPLDTAADIKNFLAQVARDVRLRKLEPKAASTLSYICMNLLRAIEVADLERRLAELEGKNK